MSCCEKTDHEKPLNDRIYEFQQLNTNILDGLQRLDPTRHKAYIVNTGIVARHRLDIVNALIPQLEKNPNKAGKVEKRIMDEIMGGVRGSVSAKAMEMGDLIQQAKNELDTIECKIRQQRH